jgi:hypothetical protein
VVKNILDLCFDLTRADVVGNDGTHLIQHHSSKVNVQANVRSLQSLTQNKSQMGHYFFEHRNLRRGRGKNNNQNNNASKQKKEQQQNNRPNNKGKQKETNEKQSQQDEKSQEQNHDNTTAEEDLDVLVTTNLYLIKKIFNSDQDYLGKMFSYFMHPNHRFAYMFEYLKQAKYEANYDEKIANMSLLDYAKYLQNNPDDKNIVRLSNWMTRSLTHSSPQASLGDNHVELATVILKEKCVVLLYDKMAESIRRLEKLFTWRDANDDSSTCIGTMLERPIIDETMVNEKDRELWQLLSGLNELDIQLYRNVCLIFHEQGIELFGKLFYDMVA